MEVRATDEHRIGLKPIHRRVWAPVGERPLALGHHRYEWLYVTAFVAPASGETVWFVSNGIDKPFFAKLLASLRASEVVRLKVKHIDSAQKIIRIEQATLPKPCPCCGGRMIIIETFARGCQPKHHPTTPASVIRIDTS